MLKYLVVCLLIFGTSFAKAQTYAFIDSDYILKNVPEYTEAKEKLDKMAERWTKEIEDRYAVVKSKKDNYQREEVLLPKEEKEKRKQEIEKLEKEAIELEKRELKEQALMRFEENLSKLADVFDLLNNVERR
ncbi:MAG: OmpH family outer membrane protein, partial [Crocinitomicaceae bacterium]